MRLAIFDEVEKWRKTKFLKNKFSPSASTAEGVIVLNAGIMG